MDDRQNFTSGPILKKLMLFAMPVLAALFLQAMYGAVDLWAVGRFGTTADMSAVSTGSQAMLVVTGFVTGLCMGITVLLGKRMGEKNYEKAAEILGAAVWILGILSVVVTIGIIVLAPVIADFVNSPEEAFSKNVAYLRICGIGTVFIVAYNGLSGIFRGLGNSKIPLLFVFISCIANIVGDIVLIEFFKLGAAGAAIATVGSQAVSVLFSAVYIRKKGMPFEVRKSAFKFRRDTAAEIVKLGMPIALSDMCNEICYLIIIGYTNELGVVVSAGVGVAEKIIVFLLLIPMAYMASVSSFTAQNIGAGKQDRAVKATFLGMAAAGAMGLVLSYILAFHGDLLSLAFVRDTEVINASATFLKATALECLILSVANCFVGYFNGKGKTTFVMTQGLISIFLVKIPYGWIALRYMENKLFQIGLATVWGAVFTLCICIIYFVYDDKKSKKLTIKS